MRTSNLILVVDDDEDDQIMLQRAFRQNGVSNPIHCVSSGNEALQYLKGQAQYADRDRFPYPSFILTDLHMPTGDGLSVLEYLNNHPDWGVIPTLVLTASADPDDIKRSYLLGASAYLVKPTEFTALRKLLRLCYEFWNLCEVPAADAAGHWVRTDHRGRLGERFTPPNDADKVSE